MYVVITPCTPTKDVQPNDWMCNDQKGDDVTVNRYSLVSTGNVQLPTATGMTVLSLNLQSFFPQPQPVLVDRDAGYA